MMRMDDLGGMQDRPRKVKVPSVVIHDRELGEWAIKRSSDYNTGKTVVLFGLPGAFTPTCSDEMLPAYDKLFDTFKASHVDDIICFSVNDAFVMNAWFKELGIKNVKPMPDGNGEFSEAMGLLVDKKHLGFGKRTWRCAFIIKDGWIEFGTVEEGQSDVGADSDPYEQTTPEFLLEQVRGLNKTMTAKVV